MTTIGGQAADANAQDGTMGTVGGVAASCPNTALEIGVFFDGTGNNSANVIAGPSFMSGSSYSAARTNVALLSDLYKQKVDQWEQDGTGYCRKFDMLYVQGIGTTADTSDYRPDNLTGTINGMGPTGVESRVFQACIDLGQKITLLSGGAEPTEIIVDVFGFSRGAAAARYFVNCFRQGFIQYNAVDWSIFEGSHVDERRAFVPEGRNLRFRFVGIFDTVAAIGWADDDDNGPVNVHCSTAQADRIFHLTAANEFRKNFRLNHNVPGGGDTREMPGAHSDVGGGYTSGPENHLLEEAEDHSFYTREAAEAARAADVAAAQAAQTDLNSFFVEEGWIEPGNPSGALQNMPTEIVERRLPGIAGLTSGRTYTYTTSTRMVRDQVNAGLSRIPLRIMYDAARATGVPFGAYPSGDTQYAPPDGLPAGVADRMIAGGEPSEAERRTMLQGWGHISSRLNSVQDRLGHAPDEDFERVIYYNNAGAAK
ncbi:T6SS phospholipase effector Tle1-like catalytic domain-containing protein [Tateyamaria sp. SN6-1]|uniref:T6SS phospholipase effector Tle1-like catalytic domain-containing protein n=1 Tax=Tateyamaria sp. SN6-1 TaxID=3092148 RepID=UPI0039F4F48F